MSGRSRCRLHGGKSLVGPASKTWKHGRYSKLLGKIGYDGVFDEAARDRNLICVHNKMALMDAREAKLLERLRPDGGADSMAAIRDAYDAVMGATAPEERQVQLEALGGLLEAGVSDGAVWAEVYEVIEVRRKLTETEGKNIERLHKVLHRRPGPCVRGGAPLGAQDARAGYGDLGEDWGRLSAADGWAVRPRGA